MRVHVRIPTMRGILVIEHRITRLRKKNQRLHEARDLTVLFIDLDRDSVFVKVSSVR